MVVVPDCRRDDKDLGIHVATEKERCSLHSLRLYVLANAYANLLPEPGGDIVVAEAKVRPERVDIQTGFEKLIMDVVEDLPDVPGTLASD